MKWTSLVLVPVALLAGCRSSEQATNPFLRTTVPPPGTGEAVVVTPGQPYYPGATAPPVVSPGTAPAPIVTPSPVAPAPAAMPGGFSPTQNDRFVPPGGSFQYHQSSIEGPRGDPLASARRDEEPLEIKTLREKPQPIAKLDLSGPETGDTAGQVAVEVARGPSDAVKQALHLAAETDKVLLAAHRPGRSMSGATSENTLAQISEAPPPANQIHEKVALRAEAGGENSLRIVGQSETRHTASPTIDTAGDANRAVPAFHLVAEESAADAAAWNKASRQPDVSPASQVRLVSAQEAATPAQTPGRPIGTGAGPGYGHAADYSSLRGRLEYSESARQWKLRYIPIDGQTDPYGGSVVLEGAVPENLKPGQYVTVRGSLSGQNAGGASFAPRYQLESLEALSQ